MNENCKTILFMVCRFTSQILFTSMYIIISVITSFNKCQVQLIDSIVLRKSYLYRVINIIVAWCHDFVSVLDFVLLMERIDITLRQRGDRDTHGDAVDPELILRRLLRSSNLYILLLISESKILCHTIFHLYYYFYI